MRAKVDRGGEAHGSGAGQAGKPSSPPLIAGPQVCHLFAHSRRLAMSEYRVALCISSQHTFRRWEMMPSCDTTVLLYTLKQVVRFTSRDAKELAQSHIPSLSSAARLCDVAMFSRAAGCLFGFHVLVSPHLNRKHPSSCLVYVVRDSNDHLANLPRAALMQQPSTS